MSVSLPDTNYGSVNKPAGIQTFSYSKYCIPSGPTSNKFEQFRIKQNELNSNRDRANISEKRYQQPP